MKKLVNFRHIVLLLVAMLMALPCEAQHKHKKFDAAKFQADLEQYIVTTAGLTPDESAKFFPIYREMRKKQRAIFDEMRRYRHVDICDNKACEKAIKKQDELDIELKTLQRDYHEKFIRVIPASKVFQLLKAEEKFHRQAFKRAAGK